MRRLVAAAAFAGALLLAAAPAYAQRIVHARKGLRPAYDAAYLELCLRKRATLVSKDRDLLAADKRCSVPTINIEP